jgi:hypothetical protein
MKLTLILVGLICLSACGTNNTDLATNECEVTESTEFTQERLNKLHQEFLSKSGKYIDGLPEAVETQSQVNQSLNAIEDFYTGYADQINWLETCSPSSKWNWSEGDVRRNSVGPAYYQELLRSN